MLKGEIKPKFFKVTFYEATNWGYEAMRVKYFKTRKDTKRYALKLVEELKEIAKVSEDFEYVQIENEKGEIADFWGAEDGEVVYDC